MSDVLQPATHPRPVPRRSSLVEEVVGQLRTLIESQGFAPGDRLPSEVELTSRLAVSRTVLREAVRQLSAIGLVQVRHGHGMFVGDGSSLAGCLGLVRSAMTVSRRDLTQFVELRAAIECHVARRAAELAGAEDVERLTALCGEMGRPGLAYEETIGLDFAFHRALVEITGNEVMLNVVGVLQQVIVEGMVQTAPQPRDRVISRKLHRAILAAVSRGDPDAAEAAMRDHMQITRERLWQAGSADEAVDHNTPRVDVLLNREAR